MTSSRAIAAWRTCVLGRQATCRDHAALGQPDHRACHQADAVFRPRAGGPTRDPAAVQTERAQSARRRCPPARRRVTGVLLTTPVAYLRSGPAGRHASPKTEAAPAATLAAAGRRIGPCRGLVPAGRAGYTQPRLTKPARKERAVVRGRPAAGGQPRRRRSPPARHGARAGRAHPAPKPNHWRARFSSTRTRARLVGRRSGAGQGGQRPVGAGRGKCAPVRRDAQTTWKSRPCCTR